MDGPWSRGVVRAGVRLHAMMWQGPGERVPPDLLLVHGLASNAQLWTGLATRLAAAGHRVVAVDQRGHGLSDATDDGYDFATLTDDLVAVGDALDLHRPVVAGQSWGGNVVVELAARHPDRVTAVVAVDGGLIELAARFPTWESAAAALAPPALDGTRAAEIDGRLRAWHPAWDEDAIRGQMANFALRPDGTVTPHLTRDHHLTILHHLFEHRPSRRFAGLDVPVLLLPVRGPGPSAPADVERAAAALGRSRVHWFDGDHDIHAEDPDGVAAVILASVADGFLTAGDGR